MNVTLIQNKISEFIDSGTMSMDVLNLFVTNNEVALKKETSLWDFKKDIPSTKDEILKTLKSICSFHNSFGGYLLFGIHEKVKDTEFELSGTTKSSHELSKLRGQFDKYFGKRIDINYQEFKTTNETTITILHIPKRKTNEMSLSPLVDGANEKGDLVLKKNHIYFRKSDECTHAISHDDFIFVASQRNYIDSNKSSNMMIDHNLPDKNFICQKFIGRSDIIQELWAWLGDEFQYAKVLAADGGKGKTSIAYEFAQLIIKTRLSSIEQVIWLTAKRKQFKALHDTYVETPETHYNNLESLMQQICLRTGSNESDIEGYSIQQLKRTAKQNLEIFPSFIIVDDIDSNDINEQRRIMESIREVSNKNSRSLLTTRFNSIYSDDSCITVPGLMGKDYDGLIEQICKRLGLQEYNIENIRKLEVASEGSPMFTESILRLCKHGMSLRNAIEEWKGKSGESVREAALKKEISELSSDAIKILIAVSISESCSRIEIYQITELDSHTVDKAIAELSSLFLINSERFIESEPRFKVPWSVSEVVLKIATEIHPDASEYIKRTEEIISGLKTGATYDFGVGAVIRQCNAFITSENFQSARATVDSLITKPKYKENADLHFLKAKIEFKDPSSTPEKIRALFNNAYSKNQRKPIFFDMWYQVEKEHGNITTQFEVIQRAIDEAKIDDGQWVYRLSEIIIPYTDTLGSISRIIKILTSSYNVINNEIKEQHGGKAQLRETSAQILDRLYTILRSVNNIKFQSELIMSAIDNGEKRTSTYQKLVECFKQCEILRIEKNDREIIPTIVRMRSYIEKAVDILSGQPQREHILRQLKELLE